MKADEAMDAATIIVGATRIAEPPPAKKGGTRSSISSSKFKEAIAALEDNI